ncbi:sulfate transporter CysZ, partial [Thermodesulfobacteriota bacterium]
MVKDFFSGARYLVQGFRLIFRPGLRRFIAVPLCISLLVFSCLLWLVIGQFGSLVDWVMPYQGHWYTTAARTVLWVLFAAVSAVIVFFTFTLATNFLSAPFNGLLAERVEAYLTGGLEQTTGTLGSILAEVPKTVSNEVRKLTYFLVLGALALSLFLVPYVNIVFPPVWVLFTAWMLGLEYASYPMENNGLSFAEVRTRLKKERWLCLGFGMTKNWSTGISV